jgi:dihydrofolate synthase / folylpolyglutamate synthase
MATATDISSYEAALAYLYGRINYERAALPAYRVQNFRLERMQELMRRLGDPQVGLPIIHVAGTKGKGSCSSMLASILTAHGLSTGLYTSPHLERTEERLTIDGACCEPDEFVAILRQLQPVVDVLDDEGLRGMGPGSPTYFELMTAMALLHFARRRVDAVVLEVGLGGRLDSTNIVIPAVSVITSISFDHMRQLGSTLAAIAGEKAGIIKPGVPVVTGVIDTEPLEVIERVARAAEGGLYRAGVDFRHVYTPREDLVAADKLPRGRVRYEGRRGDQPVVYDDLEVGLLGEHQAANAAVALATLDRLAEQGWRIEEEAVRRGLALVRCPARVEVRRVAPTVVIDTAHNPASIAALLRVLDAGRGFARRRLIFACSKDKEAATMLGQLLPHFEHVMLTRFLNNPRAIDPEELRGLATTLLAEGSIQPAVETRADPQEAWRQVAAESGPDDLVCITGSFFLAAELRGMVGAETPIAAT